LPNQKFTLKDNKIRLEKIGWIKVKVDRTYSGREMSVTVSKDLTEKYYVSILVETEQIKKEKTGKQVGIDLGIKRLITTSDGLQIKNYSDNQGIKDIQRNLSRKKKGSRRYKELKLKLAKLHKKQSQKRDWLLHNISKYLVDNYDIIAMEDLSVENLLKNKMLADKISKSSLARLTNFVEYKSIMYGRDFYKINRYYPSSKKCCKCGKIKDDLKLSDRVYICDCGNKIDRDLNASINIKTVGVHAVKQSVMDSTLPPEVRQAIPVELMNFL
jgi:putative transposase